MLPKTATSGSIHPEYKRCGKASCRCASGELHGPYYYHHFRQQGVQHKRYVAPENLLTAISDIERRKFYEINISAMKRELKELDECLKMI